MNTVNANDEVEILNNGNRLGSAPVVNGRWDYPTPHLPVGTHNLTATYRGEQSAAWRLTVEEPIYTYGFDNAPLGAFISHDLQYFTVRQASGTSPSGAVVRIDNVGSRFPGLQNEAMYMSVVTEDQSKTIDLWVELDFKKIFSTVSFKCHVLRLFDSTASGPHFVNSVQAYDDTGKIVANAYPEFQTRNTTETVSIVPSIRLDRIKSLKFHLQVSNARFGRHYEDCVIDEFVMTL